jgi:isoamylase
MAQMIPYFLELGVTTLELLPIHSFHPGENIRENPETGEKLVNFWGYSTIGFFAPCGWYATDGKGLTAVKEFKAMVKAFHEAGIEVILDVVYNHTGEGNEMGPTLSYRGLDNSIYYMLGKRKILQELLRLRQHAELQSSGGQDPYPGQPPLLGGRYESRRFSI